MMMKFFALCASIALVSAQITNSFPHDYPGKPKGDFSPAWQKYFRVTSALPNVTFPVSRSYAGSIPVNRLNHPNDTLFFWGFEQTPGSLTSQSASKPWILWLNGGPGASSMFGLLFENGPIHVTADYVETPNKFNWNAFADTIWVDQPVGTGFSTADSTGFIADEDQMAEDFLGFLSNLVKVFPSLAERPFYLTGESYAGVYIPYIVKALLAAKNPPVQLKAFAIGDGAIGSFHEFENLSTVTSLETWPQLIGFDPVVAEYFRSQAHLCKFDLNLTYPQEGHFPSLPRVTPFGQVSSRTSRSKQLLRRALVEYDSLPQSIKGVSRRDLFARNTLVSRSLEGRANGTIDPFYGCFSLGMLLDYAFNFTFPYMNQNINPYNAPDALNPESNQDAAVFLNDARTRAALHAPTSKDWVLQTIYPFGNTLAPSNDTNVFGDPSVEPMAFFSDLVTDATSRGIKVVIYSGNNDLLVGHFGTEVVIQNTTWGGIQGFTQKPATPWHNDQGEFAGIVHQERGLTYVLFDNAGHQLPLFQPENALVFLREFILGDNPTGFVDPKTHKTFGGVDPALEKEVLPAWTRPVFYGSGTTASSTVWPKATIDAWEKFFATAG